MPRNSRPAPTVGDLVRIEILDHAEGDELMMFEVIGRLTKITKRSYTVGCWLHTDPIQKATMSPTNEHCFTVGRGLVESIKCLK